MDIMGYSYISLYNVKNKLNGIKGDKIVYMVDFDNNITDKITVSFSECEKIIDSCKTAILNTDAYISHIQLYTIFQEIENIQRKGVMYDVYI